MDRHQRDLARAGQEQVLPAALLLVEAVHLLAAAREEARADQRLLAREHRHIHGREPVVVGHEVHRVAQRRKVQTRAPPGEQVRARAGDLHAALEVDHPVHGHQFDVVLRLEPALRLERLGHIERREPVLLGRVPHADLHIVFRTLPDGHIRVRRLGHFEQQFVQFRLDRLNDDVEVLDLALQRRGPRPQFLDLLRDLRLARGVGLLALRHQLAHLRARFLREAVLLGAQVLLFRQGLAATLVEVEDAVDVDAHGLLPGAVGEPLWVVTQEFEIDHGADGRNRANRPQQGDSP